MEEDRKTAYQVIIDEYNRLGGQCSDIQSLPDSDQKHLEAAVNEFLMGTDMTKVRNCIISALWNLPNPPLF